MATVTKIGIEEWEQTEEEGVVVALTLYMSVTGLNNTYANNRTLDEALDAAGVPQQGDTAPGNTNLVLHRRIPRMEPGSPTKCRVQCDYKTIADWENSFVFSGGSSLQQEVTNTDIYGNLISLQYTYPNDYPVEDRQGTTLKTAINEQVYVPHTTLTATGSLFVNYPTQVSESWVWHTNSTFWAGYPAGYWLCTSCEFSARDIGIGRSRLWKFTWTFELNPRGWPVVARIVDPNTGIVPPDVVAGVGTKNVTWYPSRDFNEIFGNT